MAEALALTAATVQSRPLMRETIRFRSWRLVAEWLDPAVMTLTAPVLDSSY
jgi:hypothetical protein